VYYGRKEGKGANRPESKIPSDGRNDVARGGHWNAQKHTIKERYKMGAMFWRKIIYRG